MAKNSKIEWCDHTFNPFVGCAKVSPACDNCFAESWAKRSGLVQWGPHAERRRTSEANWKQPLKWNKEAKIQLDAWNDFREEHVLTDGIMKAKGFIKPTRPRVFCASLADVFDNAIPEQWRQDLFDLILATPNLDWLLLTKRIGNAKKMLESIAYRRGELLTANDQYQPPKNVWLGVTVCNQEEADRNIPKLLSIPAAKRFISIEPMLGPIDLERPMPGPDLDQGGGRKICQPWMIQSGIDWVICGGESGLKARPLHPDWVGSLRDQCAAAGVPFMFKQWGEWIGEYDIDSCNLSPPEISDAADFFRSYTWDDREVSFRVGKKAAGRLLDGVIHDEFPGASHD